MFSSEVSSNVVLVLTGWSILVALWHTTAVALVFGIWRLRRRAAPAQVQHVAALWALAGVVALTAGTPVALMSASSATPAAGTDVEASTAQISSVQPRSPRATNVGTSTLAQAMRSNAVTPWIGLAWFVGVVVGLFRLAGGWGVARWIRQHAQPVSAPGVLEAAAQVSGRWRFPEATLLTSEHVEAPVVIGHRLPVIVLPRDAERHLTLEALSPLLAHELAHIARRDYLANLLQSVMDALLFFSPGARWISRCVRETREYCCDDLVVERCGPVPYVNALTTLAALGAMSRARPAIGAAGPRLIVRIRRLLKEEVMTSFIGYRLTALTATLVLVVISGTGLPRLSAAGIARATGGAQDPADVSSNAAVPIADARQQSGADVSLRSVLASSEGLCGTADVYNGADTAVTGLRFVAVVSSQGKPMPVSIATSDWLEVDLPPLGEARIDVALMPASDVHSRMKGARAQVMCALQGIRFANNSSWSMTPNPAARTAEDALGFGRPAVSRALIEAAATTSEPNTCRDDNGGRYSEGAIVWIRFEPGRRARCAGARWVDYVATPVPAKPVVVLELRWPNGPTPVLKVAPGQMGTVRIGASNWGLRPIVDGADPARFHVLVYDLASQPHQQVADILTTAGGDAVSSETNPPFTVRVVSSGPR